MELVWRVLSSSFAIYVKHPLHLFALLLSHSSHSLWYGAASRQFLTVPEIKEGHLHFNISLIELRKDLKLKDTQNHVKYRLDFRFTNFSRWNRNFSNKIYIYPLPPFQSLWTSDDAMQFHWWLSLSSLSDCFTLFVIQVSTALNRQIKKNCIEECLKLFIPWWF